MATMEHQEGNYVIIFNPIYDVVFRYLVQGYNSALVVLSILINANINKPDFLSLTFSRTHILEGYGNSLIFILKVKIEDKISDIMIKIRQIKTGVFTGKILDRKNKFINCQSDELYAVQLPHLQEIQTKVFEGDEYGTKLNALLKLFDPKWKRIFNFAKTLKLTGTSVA